MEYFTTAEQERVLAERYRLRMEQHQDRMRQRRFSIQKPVEIPEEDRCFFVESDGVYFGEVRSDMVCPIVPVTGGATYEVDPIFLAEVQQFVKRHNRYMIVFRMAREYHRRAGIYPARMVSEEEEIVLEDTQ